jgi:hypothetical protein
LSIQFGWGFVVVVVGEEEEDDDDDDEDGEVDKGRRKEVHAVQEQDRFRDMVV